MNFFDLAAARYSVRSFADKPVEQKVIDKLLQAALLAPTACNRQPQRILVINGGEGIQKLRKCTECHFNAPRQCSCVMTKTNAGCAVMTERTAVTLTQASSQHISCLPQPIWA